MTLISYFRLLAEDRPDATRWAWFWKPVLRLGSFLYLLGYRCHRWLYGAGIFKTGRFNCHVISVGNITWGGTGKTPLVEYVARFYLNRGMVPLILARGYGKDESRMLARELPQAKFGIGKDRYQAGLKAQAGKTADVIILDDGFQHWCLRRDLDIVAVNALNPFGNGSLIPRGILRESSDSLKRASLVVLTDVNLIPRKELERLKAKIRQVAPHIEFIEAHREPLYFYRPGSRERVRAERLQGERITSFSGIGTPRSFQMLLNQMGLKMVRNFEFSDHHSFTERELNEVCQAKEASESVEIITTEKDFFRCEEMMRRKVKPLVLKVRLRLTTGEGLLHQYLSRFVGASHVESSRKDQPKLDAEFGVSSPVMEEEKGRGDDPESFPPSRPSPTPPKDGSVLWLKGGREPENG